MERMTCLLCDDTSWSAPNPLQLHAYNESRQPSGMTKAENGTAARAFAAKKERRFREDQEHAGRAADLEAVWATRVRPRRATKRMTVPGSRLTTTSTRLLATVMRFTASPARLLAGVLTFSLHDLLKDPFSFGGTCARVQVALGCHRH